MSDLTLRVIIDGQPREYRLSVNPVLSILMTAQRGGVLLRHDCGGKALCGTCRVRVVSGATSPMTGRERERLDAVNAGHGERLACQTRLAGDAVAEAILEPLSPGRSAP